ncbi:thioredoxin family protein [Ectobacillus sp. JY-23]|uniref:thioredoxin family protein n=1 Tax=Ectobacillus sp. JY-23 TaxID=2933872 RepID=UPI001FF3EE6D|nr:thioredoxin family protein [Ectobacillus sp. JY-23]UOY94333.1 thioredoxin family protein [Ectobacillus sp. JY-23]
MKKIETLEELQTVKNAGNTILLFSADWCPDCRFIEPFMPEVEEKYNEYVFYYVDRDQFIDVCIEMDVFGIPSFVAFRDGQEVGRYVNKDRKTQEQIEAFLSGL